MNAPKLLFTAIKREGYPSDGMLRPGMQYAFGEWFEGGFYRETAAEVTQSGFVPFLTIEKIFAPAYDEAVYFAKVHPVRSEEQEMNPETIPAPAMQTYKVTVSGELIVTVTYNIEAESLEAAQREAMDKLRSHYFSDHPDAVMWVEDRP